MSNGPIIYGKSEIFWCSECNLPLIDKECGKCGGEGEKVDLTPPGDISPAFGKRKLIKELIERDFDVEGGRFIPDDKIVLINPVPALDDAYEILMDGMILGQVRYEPEVNSWRILLNLEGAIRIYLLGCEKNLVEMDDDAVEFIEDGANALAPGIISSDPGIKEGDECIVVSESDPRSEDDVLATGLAKMSGPEMIKEDYGVSVKTRRYKKVDYRDLEGGKTWNEVLKANKKHLKAKEDEAITFMEDLKSKKDLPVCITFSGGKDSLAVLLLGLKAFDKNEFDILFNNTGLEFPETINYINKIQKILNKEIKRANAGNKFWKSLNDFGPPGKDYRWCCKTSKLGPISNYIENRYDGEGDKVLIFGGERKFESQNRYNRDRTWRNPWIPGEFGASPIKHWRSIEVWLLIFQEDLPYNELYERFDRIGCWLCPSSSLGELKYVKEIHPEMWEKFGKKLQEFAKNKDLPKEWIEHGLWRWKDLPPGQKNLAEDLGIKKEDLDHKRNIEEINIEKHNVDKNKDILNKKIDFSKLEKTLPILGDYKIINNNDNPMIRFNDSDLVIGEDYLMGSEKQRKKAMQIIKKAYECVQCKVCMSICPVNAIELDDNGINVGDDCISCEQCLDPCPLSLK